MRRLRHTIGSWLGENRAHVNRVAVQAAAFGAVTAIILHSIVKGIVGLPIFVLIAWALWGLVKRFGRDAVAGVIMPARTSSGAT